jgi:hypothetical protein
MKPVGHLTICVCIKSFSVSSSASKTRRRTDHDSVVAHEKAVIVCTLPIGMPTANVVVEVSVGKHFVAGRTAIQTRWHVHVLKVSLCVSFDSLSTKQTDVAGRALFHLCLH